jgi:hypothetical protein
MLMARKPEIACPAASESRGFASIKADPAVVARTFNLKAIVLLLLCLHGDTRHDLNDPDAGKMPAVPAAALETYYRLRVVKR